VEEKNALAVPAYHANIASNSPALEMALQDPGAHSDLCFSAGGSQRSFDGENALSIGATADERCVKPDASSQEAHFLGLHFQRHECYIPREPRTDLVITTADRFFKILFVFFVHGVSIAMGKGLRHVPWLRSRLPLDLDGPERLKVVLETLGGSFVKLGQMLAAQPDILPNRYCERLYNLLDRVNPVPNSEVQRVFREETGILPTEAFDEFSRKPIASGSIGQVHIAFLDGNKYAVKVQRPDTISGFRRDIKMMNSLVAFIKIVRFKPLFWMIPPLEEFSEWTKEELDFRKEARYMRELRKHAEECSHHHVPLVGQFATRRVLMVEFLEGVTLVDHMRRLAEGDQDHERWLSGVGFDANQFARNIIDVFIKGSAVAGIFHADLHPGNLLVLPNNVVGYIDFGITGVLSPFSRHRLLGTTLAFARQDIDKLCTTFFSVSAMDANSNPDGFRADMKRISERWYGRADEGSTVTTSASIVFMEMLTLSRKHNIWPQRDIIKYIRSAMAIDGLIRRFAPDFDVSGFLATTSRKYLVRHARAALFSQDAFINWSKATSELSSTGAFRFSSFLDRLANTKPDDQARERSRLARQSFGRQIAAIGLLILCLAFATNETYEIGVNLFSSQILVAAIFFASALNLRNEFETYA